MNSKNIFYTAFCTLLVLFAVSCKDAWDDHVAPVNTANDKNLLEVINANENYSSFAALLKESGYDKSLETSKNFTVWVPTNQAIADFKVSNPNYLDTAANVKFFVGFHIVNATYKIDENATDTLRLKTIGNKYVNLIAGKVDDISAATKNIYVKNGVYHVINTVITPKNSIFTIVSRSTTYQQSKVITSLDTLVSDSLYRLNPQWVSVRNRMVQEPELYTYFVLTDNAYANEYNKILPYYFTKYDPVLRPDSSSKLFTTLAMIRDVMVPGYYSMDKLPDTLVSISGVKIPINKNNIVSSKRASNGIVYYVNSLPYRLKDRVPVITISGQNPIGFKQNDKRGVTYYRTKVDTTGRLFKDIEIYGHGVSEFYIDYRKTAAQSVKYKVYATAISGLLGDPQKIEFTQRFQIYNPLTNLFNAPVTNELGAPVVLFTHLVKVRYSDRVYLGEYTKSDFGNLNVRLISAANTSTTASTNTLILESIVFEPVLP